MKKIIIVWNIVLTFFVVILWLNFIYEDKSSYDTSQNTVLCRYIEDLQSKTGIDTKTMADCQGDIDLIFKVVN